ncbi:MAG: hypothetical protein R6W89_09625 [Candidatus Hydrogenedentota bacterium]
MSFASERAGSAVALNPCIERNELKRVKEAFWHKLRTSGLDSHLMSLVEVLEPSARIFVVGGFLRDCARQVQECKQIDPKDLDVVVDTELLSHALYKIGARFTTTPLGGYRWQPYGAGAWMDMWQLKDTIWLRDKTGALSIWDYLAGVDLNIDRIAFDFQGNVLCDDGCLAGLASHTIDLDATIHVEHLLPYELVRAVVAHIKTSYAVTSRVTRLIKRCDAMTLAKAGEERLPYDGYGEEMLTTIRAVMQSIRVHGGCAAEQKGIRRWSP